MQGGILTPPFAIITYAVLLNYQSLLRDPAPGPAAAPAGDTSGPTPHSLARSGRSRWRPARSPRLLPPLSAQYAWCRWHTASPCRSSPGRRVYARPAAAPADRGTATGGRFSRSSWWCLCGRSARSGLPAPAAYRCHSPA